jgi:hypothetical protein
LPQEVSWFLFDSTLSFFRVPRIKNSSHFSSWLLLFVCISFRLQFPLSIQSYLLCTIWKLCRGLGYSSMVNHTINTHKALGSIPIYIYMESFFAFQHCCRIHLQRHINIQMHMRVISPGHRTLGKSWVGPAKPRRYRS